VGAPVASSPRQRWLVTGGAGFIGFHVAAALLAQGDELVIVDTLADSPYPRANKVANLAALGQLGTYEHVAACVTDRAALDAALVGVSRIIHLAGLAGVRHSFSDPAAYMRINVEGTATVLAAARAAGVQNVVFASSSSVYGNLTRYPATEDEPCTDLESPYAASKRACELVAAAMLKGAPEMFVTALRYFTVYGPRQRPEMAISLFARNLLHGAKLPMFGDGGMERDFTHVDDAVRATLLASERQAAAIADRRQGGLSIYNIGGGAPVSLRTLIAILERETGMTADVHRFDRPRGDVERTYADPSRAASELGFRCTTKLEDGLRSVVEWQKSQGPSAERISEPGPFSI
jgi:UDP-glucuronate 4-epimerase